MFWEDFIFFMVFSIRQGNAKTKQKTEKMKGNAGKQKRRLEGLTCQQPQDGGVGSSPEPAGAAGAAGGFADSSVGSTRATSDVRDAGLDGATFKFAGDVAIASSSVLQAIWEGKGGEIAPMGSEGSIGAELDSERTRMREKTPEVPASSEPAGSGEEGPTMLGCASVSAGACACVGVCACVASCATTLMTFRSIRP